MWFIRLFGISVFAEGNVIDLGGYKLQVAEACDGLRYLFPLMTLGLLMAYFFKAPLWKRVVLFVSSIPITIFMNSLRIGTIGVMVEHWGTRMAEGFLHDFQGWAVFMVSAALLLGGNDRARAHRPECPSLARSVHVDLPAKTNAPLRIAVGAGLVPRGHASSLAAVAVGANLLPQRQDSVPAARAVHSRFRCSSSNGADGAMCSMQVYLNELQLDDYILADYVRGTRAHQSLCRLVRLAASRAVRSFAALVSAGRRLADHDSRQHGRAAGRRAGAARQSRADRARQPEAARVLLVPAARPHHHERVPGKWYLFWDSLTRQRSDGALVRLVTPLASGEAVDARRGAAARVRGRSRPAAAATHSELSARRMELMLGFLVAMSITMALIPPLMQVAARLRFLDAPTQRKVHSTPVPRVGGIAMAAGTLLALTLSGEFAQPMPAFLAGVVVLLVFGVWDDRAC